MLVVTPEGRNPQYGMQSIHTFPSVDEAVMDAISLGLQLHQLPIYRPGELVGARVYPHLAIAIEGDRDAYNL